MNDLTYFAWAMIFNHWWKIGIVVITCIFLFGCGTYDCPDDEKTNVDYGWVCPGS